MANDAEPMLLDTNVLVYAHFPESEFFAASRGRLESAQQEDAGLCVAPQNLIEFFAIVTSPKRVSQPQPPDNALSAIEDILSLPGIRRLTVPADLITRWLDLARASSSPKRAFDLQLVATMQGNGVRRICTLNEADFRGIPNIEVVAP
jgi:predicted nucleic acid-binding protein